MASTFYLEHYVDSLDPLPAELRRNFNLMFDLDKKNKATLKEVGFSSTPKHKLEKWFIILVMVSVRTYKTNKELNHFQALIGALCVDHWMIQILF